MSWSIKEGFEARGDQPKAVKEILKKIKNKEKYITLHGATGTGKSATVALVLSELKKPTLIIAPNKVLAAQLVSELRELLPDVYIGYFISHFAYYRPEAYVPNTDTFIEKDSAIDSEIERLRHEATLGILTKKEVIIVASVSAIFGLGRPEEYSERMLYINSDMIIDRDEFIKKMVGIGYSRNDVNLIKGCFRVRGTIVDIIPSSGVDAYRIEFDDNCIESMKVINPATGEIIKNITELYLTPTSHHIFNSNILDLVLSDIESELKERIKFFKKNRKIIESERIKIRTKNDLESLRELGMTKGIENYSRHFDRRKIGEPPATLLDYFQEEFITVIDESHITIPQIGAMYEGDQSRKRTLVEYGFRLPSALDNRPLKNNEFWGKVKTTLLLSATPGDFEYKNSKNGFVEQIIRPTGLVDPKIYIRPRETQFEDMLREVSKTINNKERVLITTVTKKFAEQISDKLLENKIMSSFIHSDVKTSDRIDTLKNLRLGEIDVLVGVNLLREGLDLPEVSKVIVFDADLEGFLRSERSLIQIVGRAARNLNGTVIFYADSITPAMKSTIDETNRRRAIQEKYNIDNNISPKQLVKKINSLINRENINEVYKNNKKFDSISDEILYLENEMKELAKNLKFEEAMLIREELYKLKKESKIFKEEFGI
jgi:excinuclease ABC subunit B